MNFSKYNEYMNIVSITNDIFDYWFYKIKRLDSSPLAFLSKKEVNNLPVCKQTDKIIDILEENNANKELIFLFNKRKDIELILFDKTRKNSLELNSLIHNLKKNCLSQQLDLYKNQPV